MALRALRNPRLISTINILSPLISCPKSTSKLHFAVSSPIDGAALSPNNVARQLFDQFSKPPNLRDADCLTSLGLRLTPEAVESAIKDLRSWRAAHDLFRWATWQAGYRHTCYTYNAIAAVLSRARQKPHLKSLAQEVIENQCPMTSGALGFLIRCLGDQNLVDEAILVFNNSERLKCFPNSYAYNCLLEVLAKAGEVNMVEARFDEMVAARRVIDKYTLTAVLKCYCNAGELEKVLNVFETINEKGWVDEHVLTLLIVTFCKWGNVDKAFELVEKMEGFGMRLSEKTFCVLVHGFVKERRADKAVEIFEKMKRSGFVADLAIFSVLIQGLCEAKHLDKAWNLYLEMRESDVCPDVHLVSTMILSFCIEGDFETANRLLEEEGEQCSFGNLVSLYNAVLDGLIRCGKVVRAHKLVREMMNSQGSQVTAIQIDENEVDLDCLFVVRRAVCPNADSFSFVITGLCKNHKLDIALVLLDDMFGMGCKGKLSMYNDLIYELCDADRLEDSYLVLRKMKDHGFSPSEFTNNAIFYCLCKRGDVLNVLNLLKDMQQQGHVPWIKHTTMLVQQLCESGKVVEASGVLYDMTVIGFLPDMIAISAVINGYCMIGEMDKALSLFRNVLSRDYDPDVVAHNVLMNGFCKAGRLEEAQEILKEMLAKGLAPSVVTYNLMIDGWCKAEMSDEALNYYSKMLDELKSPTVVTYTTLIDGMLNAGRADDAIGFWDEMKKNGCAPNNVTYMAIVHGLCKCGRIDSALAYFVQMQEKGFLPDPSEYLLLIDSFILEGNSLKAFELFQEAIQKHDIHSTNSKKCELFRKAVSSLYNDSRTSVQMKKMIDSGCIPLILTVQDITQDVKK